MDSRRILALLLVVAFAAAACTFDADDSKNSGDSDDTGTAATDQAGTGAAPTCPDETVAVGDDGQTIAAIVEQAAGENDLTSVVYRVTRGDEVVASGTVGESMTDVPATPDMHFRVGNVVFAYMGTLLLLFGDRCDCLPVVADSDRLVGAGRCRAGARLIRRRSTGVVGVPGVLRVVSVGGASGRRERDHEEKGQDPPGIHYELTLRCTPASPTQCQGSEGGEVGLARWEERDLVELLDDLGPLEPADALRLEPGAASPEVERS